MTCFLIYRLFGTFKLCCGSWSKLDRIQHLSLSGSIFRIQIHIIKKGGLQAPTLLKFFLKEVFQRINCYKKIVSIICPKLIIQIGADFRIQCAWIHNTAYKAKQKLLSTRHKRNVFAKDSKAANYKRLSFAKVMFYFITLC